MATKVDRERFVSVCAPGSFEAEQYRLLRHILEQMRKDSGAQMLAVTSPAVGDGKTTTAINLAAALGQARDARILLMDLDLRRASLGAQLGIAAAERGLADLILDGDGHLGAAIRHWSRAGVDVVGGGRLSAAPWELLKSPRLGRLLDEARDRYDYVVVDTPPIIPVPDCRVIARWVDAFLMVVAAHKTPRRLVEEALDALDSSKLAGLIFNRDDRWSSKSYGYYAAYAPSANGHRRWWGRLQRG